MTTTLGPGIGATESELYAALVSRDSRYDGIVYFGVTSTGIFCRPVCTARKPRSENVRYFDSAQAALGAGFRPCRICRPLDPPDDMPERYRELLRAVSSDPGNRIRDADLRAAGIEPETLRRWFKRRFGVTFQAFARSARLAGAFDAIRCGSTVTEAAFASGYGSLSGFADATKAATGRSPTDAARDGVLWITRMETPLGTMVAGAYLGKLCLLEFADRRALETEIAELERRYGVSASPGRTPCHEDVERQLSEYFDGKRKSFDIELDTPGSDFQRLVWKILVSIPYGETRSYRDQASAMGRPEAVRAVARANGQNRISIVIPCHRVIGADGTLTGYGGGLPRKRALLDLESGQRGFATD